MESKNTQLFGNGVKRTYGTEAMRYNLLAARLIGDLVKGFLGPRGLEKMFIDIPPVDAPSYFMNHKVLFDETIGFADFNEPGRRTNNSDWAFKMGRVMSGWNGGVIHLHNGIHSQPLGIIEDFCKDEFARAFHE